MMTKNRIMLALASLALLAEPGARLAAADYPLWGGFPDWGSIAGNGAARGAAIEPQGVGSQASRSAGQGNPQQDRYTFERIPTPAGFFAGEAIDVNNRGAVGGLFYAPGFVEVVTFVWRRGQAPQLISHPGSSWTSVPAISDSGVMFGHWGSHTEQTAGFYQPSSGTWHPLPTYPGRTVNLGIRANNAGQAVGRACNGSLFNQTDCVNWIWNGSAYEVSPIPATPLFGGLFGINEPGVMVGWQRVPPPESLRAVMVDGATTTTLMPGTRGGAWDVNNRGEVLVQYELAPGNWRMGLLRRGEVTPLPQFPDAVWTGAYGLNERGDFAGFTWHGPNNFHPYVAFAR